MNPRVRVLGHLYRSLSSLQDRRDSQRLSRWLAFIESQASAENLDSFLPLMKFLDSIELASNEQALQIARIARKIAQLCLSNLETPSLTGDSRVIVERWEGMATKIATKNFRSGDDGGIEFLTSRVQSKNPWVRDGMMENFAAVVKEAPGLAKELLVQLMIFEGESTDELVPFGSLALPMSTYKSSIERTVLWKGQREFQDWLNIAPEEFTEAVLQITQHIVINKEHVNNIKEEDFSIPLPEGHFGYIEDMSYIWDSGGHGDYRYALIDQFQDQLDAWASSQKEEYRRSLGLACETILSQNRLAVFWKRCLLLLAKHPEVFQKLFAPLLFEPEILLGDSTIHAAGEGIASVYPIWEKQKRVQFEELLRTLPIHYPGIGERRQKRLLKCLKDVSLDNAELDTFRRQLIEAELDFENRPLFEMSVAYLGPDDEDEESSEDPLAEFFRYFKQFGSDFLNNSASCDALQTIYPKLQDAANCYEQLLLDRKRTLADTLATCARSDHIQAVEGFPNFLKSQLMRIAKESSDPPKDEEENDFEKQFGMPWRERGFAAEGLLRLSRHLYDSEVKEAIVQLANNESKEVRYFVALNLIALYEADKELVWQLAEQFSKQERSAKVLHWLVNRFLFRRSPDEPEKTSSVAISILERRGEIDGDLDKLCEELVDVLTAIAIFHDVPVARNFIESLFQEIDADAKLVCKSISSSNVFLCYDDENHPQKSEAVRQRAFAYLHNAAKIAVERYAEARNKQDAELARWAIKCMDAVADALLFGLRKYRENAKLSENEMDTSPLREEFFDRALPVLRVLVNTPHPHTGLHLIEVMQPYATSRPRDVIALLHGLLTQNRLHASEGLVKDYLVKIIGAILSDCGDFLRHEYKKRVIQILDVFIRQGWQEVEELIRHFEADRS